MVTSAVNNVYGAILPPADENEDGVSDEPTGTQEKTGGASAPGRASSTRANNTRMANDSRAMGAAGPTKGTPMAPPMGRTKADKRATKQNMDLFLSKSVRGINNTRMANASRWMGEAGQRKGKTMTTPSERAKAKEGDHEAQQRSISVGE